jgi:hypothetical protein
MGLMALCVVLVATFCSPWGVGQKCHSGRRCSALALANLPFLEEVGEQS